MIYCIYQPKSWNLSGNLILDIHIFSLHLNSSTFTHKLILVKSKKWDLAGQTYKSFFWFVPIYSSWANILILHKFCHFRSYYFTPGIWNTIFEKSGLTNKLVTCYFVLQPYLMGVVVPDEEVIDEWKKKNNVTQSLAEICSRKVEKVCTV